MRTCCSGIAPAAREALSKGGALSSHPTLPLPRCLQGEQLITCGWPDAICINHAGDKPECKRPDVPTMSMGVAAQPDSTGLGGAGVGVPSPGTSGVTATLEGVTGGTLGGVTLPSLTSILGGN